MSKKSVVKKHTPIMQFNIYGTGATGKMEKKASFEARSATEAKRKGERFALMAGFKFSHIEVQ